MSTISIRDIQGTTLNSSLADTKVTTHGVVTAILRKGFYIQTPNTEWDGKSSDAIFVFGDSDKISLGNWVQIGGEVIDYCKHDNAKPVTQIRLRTFYLIEETGPKIQSIPLNEALLNKPQEQLVNTLNSLEGMLVTIPAGARFSAPSNNFGDYVCGLPFHYDCEQFIATNEGGLIPRATHQEAWLPGFRVRDYCDAIAVNVGDTLTCDITGPLHFRADSWQVAVNQSFKIKSNSISITETTLTPSGNTISVLTLNCFNLDRHIEREHKVKEPRMDVDDDWGEGRFVSLAKAIIEQAKLPDVIALQEIQDNDGAEITGNVDASHTYRLLISVIKNLADVRYAWADIPPEAGADGGQPGGNIRNGFLYNPARVTLDQKSLQRLGENAPSYKDSRKPLIATFIENDSQQALTVINVHLASKREQNSIFSPVAPGFDARESVRVEQAKLIASFAQKLNSQKQAYYITGDFNDHEHSATLATLTNDTNTNLLFTLPENERYDYNHRGKLQVLMHGLVPNYLHINSQASYEILHGNEIKGVNPGETSDKPSDHAYVIAKIKLACPTAGSSL